ncbi:hypothetical protein JMA43_13820 [Joostella sp. CR20]
MTLILVFGIMTLSFSQEKEENYFDYLQKHSLGGIENKYVLTLDAYIPDCGEFGGHQELIEIKRIDKKLTAFITIYDKVCDGQTYTNHDKILSKNSYEINDDQVKLIIEYLKKLLESSLKYEMVSHADYEFGAKLDWAEKTDYNFKRLDIRFREYGSKWTEFEKLKSELKNK